MCFSEAASQIMRLWDVDHWQVPAELIWYSEVVCSSLNYSMRV